MLLLLLLLTADIRVASRPDGVDALVDGQKLTALEFGGKWDKPFLYPLRTPSGALLSRGWPVAERPGDSRDHVWHRGLFFGHGDINGIDFWRELGPGKTGKVIVTRPPVWRKGVLTVSGDLVPPQGRRMGSIHEEYRFARAGSAYEVDARMTFAADAGIDLKLGDTEEAAFGVRLTEEFREDRGATLLNSSGLTGTKNIWGKQAEWVDYSTTIENRKVGIAILDHPSNPRHPTYWHARGYGLNAANAFGVRDFTRDKTKDGSMTVAKGQSLTFRYLLILHDGDAAEARIAQRFASWKTK
jgi:hypothetical protein